MKRKWLLFLLLASAWGAKAQTLVVQDTKFYANNNQTAMAYIPDVIQTSDGGYAFVGKTGGPGGGPFPLCPSSANGNPVMGKLDASGNVQWIKNWCDTPYYANTICQTPDGGYAINGGTYPNASMSLFRYDSSAKFLWRADYGKAANCVTEQIINTPDHGFLMLGYAYGKDADIPVNYQWPPVAFQPCDWVVMKLDSMGRKQWVRTLGTSGDEYSAQIICVGKSYYLIGDTESKDHDCADVAGHPGVAIYIIKLDSAGSVVWSKARGSGVVKRLLYDDRDNSILVTGQTDGGLELGPFKSSQDLFLMKLDTAGNFKWGNLYGTPEYESPMNGVAKGPNGGYFLAGGFGSGPSNNYTEGAILVAIDATGKLIQQRSISGGKNSGTQYYHLLSATNGGLAAFGRSGAKALSEGTGQNMKYDDSTYCLTMMMSRLKVSPVGIEDFQMPGSAFTLSPNPASGGAALRFGASHSEGWLTCTGSSGQTVLRQRVDASSNSVTLSTGSWHPGAYTVCWQPDLGARQCEKLLVH